MIKADVFDFNKEYFACLALYHSPGLGPRTSMKMLDYYGSAYLAVQDASNWFGKKFLNEKYANLFIREKWRPKAEAEFRAAQAHGMNRLVITDPAYPELLRQIPDPPLVLYYQGDLSLLDGMCVAVVGARKCTEHGLMAVERISIELSKMGVTIVSGMALGIDRRAHWAGLSGIGKTIAVLGAGLDSNYPVRNSDLRDAIADQGLVMTEFGPGVIPDAKNFPQRNRIISGVSRGVIVGEAAEKSGSLITARLAAEQGRDVFALPGPVGAPTFTGCHRLIRQGAALVETGEDVLEILAQGLGTLLVPDEPLPESVKYDPGNLPLLKAASIEDSAPEKEPELPDVVLPDPDLSDDENEVLVLLREGGGGHIDNLTRSLGWDSSRVSRTLLMLEMSGKVRQLPGMVYAALELGEDVEEYE